MGIIKRKEVRSKVLVIRDAARVSSGDPGLGRPRLCRNSGVWGGNAEKDRR